jgi:RNA polymerase sigma-70 factor, ECF subfamily
MNEAALAERIARESYGRLLALLTARTRDVAAAEDALADAFAAALTAWPRIGAPEKPEAWLFAAAKRKLIDSARRARTASDAQGALALAAEEIEAEVGEGEAPDRRLGLMFACAHPAIEESVRTPLMLQTVLGFSAERIAAAFLIEAKAMGQRLVRAKAKLHDAGVPFEIPPPALWPERLAAVLDAIYAAYGVGWTDAVGADPERRGLAEEGVWLGRVLAAQAPEEPEALGLLSLMLHLEARRPARRGPSGEFVPLEDQDVSLWNAGQIVEADVLLVAASRLRRPGRYQLEAAIQSAHAVRRLRGAADWDAIVTLYEGLALLTGSPVAQLNHAAALAHRDGPAAALDLVDALERAHPTMLTYQPYWALRADLCAKLGRRQAALAAYDEAIAREHDPAVLAFLRGRAALLEDR